MQKYQYDRNGIKILPPQKKTKRKVGRTCWKVKYFTAEEAEYKASKAHDLRGDYVAYKCPNIIGSKDHWHIGHQPVGTKKRGQTYETYYKSYFAGKGREKRLQAQKRYRQKLMEQYPEATSQAQAARMKKEEKVFRLLHSQ